MNGFADAPASTINQMVYWSLQDKWENLKRYLDPQVPQIYGLN